MGVGRPKTKRPRRRTEPAWEPLLGDLHYKRYTLILNGASYRVPGTLLGSGCIMGHLIALFRQTEQLTDCLH